MLYRLRVNRSQNFLVDKMSIFLNFSSLLTKMSGSNTLVYERETDHWLSVNHRDLRADAFVG